MNRIFFVSLILLGLIFVSLCSEKKEKKAKKGKKEKVWSDKSIWNKYKTRLGYEIAKKFCKGKTDCDFIKKTQFQLITTPMNAIWNTNKEQLNRDVVGFAPAWAPSYKPMSTSQDGIFSELYKNYLLKTKNLEQFKHFMENKPQNSNAFYNWNEHGQTLDQFIEKCKTVGKGKQLFSFKMDLNSKSKFENSWAKLGQYDGEKTFIRAYIAKDNNNPKPKSDSDFIFGGSTVYHHVYHTHTVIIKTNKFDFKMSATDLSPINVKPGKEWFNYTEFTSNIEGRQHLGYVSGTNRKAGIKLLPTHVVVASRPTVEIIVSKSIYQSMEKSIKDKSVLGWLVGGAKFRAPQVKALNDDGTMEFYSKEEIESGFAAATADEIFVEKIDDYETPKSDDSEFQNSDLERFFDETSRYAQMMEHRREQEEGKTESDWLFWGGTRHETVHHHVNKPVKEGNYRITWVSHSDVPQILAVVSESL